MRREPHSPALALAGDLAPRLRRLVRAGIALTVAGWVVYTAYVLLDPKLHLGADTLVTTWLFSALLLLTAAMTLARAALVRQDRVAWFGLGIGMALWALGTVCWSLLYQHLEAPPYPSFADALYLAFYPGAYVALMLLGKSRIRNVYASAWLDGLIGVLGIAALGVAVVIPTVVADTGGTLPVVATNLAYPLGDLLLMAMLVGLLALTGWRLDRTWMLIGAGFLLLALADTIYLYRVANETFAEGTWLDAVWPAGMVLLAVAAWQSPAQAARQAVHGWPVLVAPMVFTLGSLFVLLYGNATEVNATGIVLAAATIVAVLVRLAVAFREVQGLAETKRQATTDDLTGLANRRLLLQRLEAALGEGAAGSGSVSLVVADLDGFKELNDTLGHHAGDILLKQLGPRLEQAVPPFATLARLGGDEFAMLIPLADVDTAVSFVEAAQRALEEPFTVRDLTIHIEASMGVATAPEHGTDGDLLMQRADVAMYQAKESRTGYAVYAPERDLHSFERLSLLGELRRAIDNDELILHYQPKGDLATGTVTGVEALVRWNHPARGLLQPVDFIPMAEQTSLMRPLTLKVLDMALRQSRAWLSEGIDLSVAVNLAGPNLLDLRMPDDVARLLTEHDVAPDRLRLEVTENIVMADPPRVLQVLERLRALGVGISLDDFGIGTSSLFYLKQLPIDELKIDRSFVKNIESEHADAVIVRSTAELGQRLGLKVVAEGVETAGAWTQLSDLGCELGQGFWLLRPVPAEELRAWLLDSPHAEPARAA